MQLTRRFRISSTFCALALLLSALISRPYAEMGIADDGTYILTARGLATTGHVSYNGWVSALLGWQLYLGAALTKLFGFSFTTVRMSGLLISMALAAVLQRTLVRAGATERNATIGTLAFVLSPLYLMLSVTFMSDVPGLFAVVICLYGCLRALESTDDRAAAGWLWLAVITNAICGTSRQTAWLGILVMVPSALWLLRARRRVLLAGAAATLVGALFIFGCMLWFRYQPYTVPPTDHLRLKSFPTATIFMAFVHFFLNFPFLLLPIVASFLTVLRKSRPRVVLISSLFLLVYLFIALYPHHLPIRLPLDPTFPQHFGFNTPGEFDYAILQGQPPILFGKTVRALLTIASQGGLIALIASFFCSQPTSSAAQPHASISWRQLYLLFVPFTIAYTLIILPRPATFGLYERYALPLLPVALVCLVRCYQERVQPQLPTISYLLIVVMATLAIAVTHNTFAFLRARVALAAELRADGVPDTSVDNGWEYNFGVELQHADHLNVPMILVPANAYVPVPPLAAGTCPMHWYDYTPHIKPLYGVSYDPNECYGPAPFAPVHYSRWLARTPGALYVVRYTAPSKP
jgi:Dolichyl-phosphate-mannose-protein mannosyltransferase